MLPDSLPPEKIAVTSDPSIVRNLLEQEFVVTHIPVSLRDIELRPGAVIGVRGEFIPSTQNFLEALAVSINMPMSYAYDIGFELFNRNFDERKIVKDRAVQVCVVAGRAVGLADAEYRPARTIDVLDALDSVNGNFWKFQKVSLSDLGVEIDLVSDDVAEPQPGDQIRLGVRITNSEVGHFGLKASLFSHRLVCSNGAVMRDNLGSVRWNYDNRVTYVSSIAKFGRGLVSLRDNQGQLKSVYAEAIERPILEEDIVRLWRRIRSAGHFTPECTDHVLEITADERQRFHSAVNERKATGQPEVASERDIYSVHNAITAAARSLPLHTRSRLERIGGDVLSLYSSN